MRSPRFPQAAPRMHRTPRWWLAALAAGLLAACSGAPEAPVTGTRTVADSSGGAISSPQAAPAKPAAVDALAGTQWPSARLGEGRAQVSCSTDYETAGDGVALPGLDYFQVLDTLESCRESGVLRLHYAGRIDAGFVDLVQRVSAMASRMEIRSRILDIDSAGGQVEEGIRAGDAIGGSGWTLWVRENAVCHSACVLILAAADNRMVSGKVGIHRMLRVGSQASTRAELNAELREVHGQLADYLQRNGTAVAVADLMMTVPSRDLRMLSSEELRLYGLDGVNAVQQDLERVTLARACGDDFVRRREGFVRDFEQQCNNAEIDIDQKNRCGRGLLRRYGFPDDRCPEHTPMAEIQGAGNGAATDAHPGTANSAAPR